MAFWCCRCEESPAPHFACVQILQPTRLIPAYWVCRRGTLPHKRRPLLLRTACFCCSSLLLKLRGAPDLDLASNVRNARSSSSESSLSYAIA
eukprot:COSAG01_NODE_48917_length_376_cov_8.992780_1_plen_91_part_10